MKITTKIQLQNPNPRFGPPLIWDEASLQQACDNMLTQMEADGWIYVGQIQDEYIFEKEQP